MAGRFTGKHAAIALVSFFGVVGAVNFTMASYASSTFGGVVVENSYVASQEYNGWLDEARSDAALGWAAETSRTQDGRLQIALSGVPQGATLSVDARHPLGREPDRQLAFAVQDDGSFVSTEPLPAGRWTLRMEVQAAGESWRHEEPIQ
jgi:nitrogen fixation protein FixH